MSRVNHGRFFVPYRPRDYVRRFWQKFLLCLELASHAVLLHVQLLFAVLSQSALAHVLVASLVFQLLWPAVSLAPLVLWFVVSLALSVQLVVGALTDFIL